MKLVLVRLHELDEAWPRLRPLVDKIPERNPEWGAGSLYRAARAGGVQVWVIADEADIRAVFFVALQDRIRGLVAEVQALAGLDIEEWADLWPAFKDAMRAFGAVRIEATGRPGLRKAFPEWRLANCVYEVEL